MLLASSRKKRPGAPDSGMADLLNEVSETNLRQYVEQISFPRHYHAERAANRRARDLLSEELRGLGYNCKLQGVYDNVLAFPASSEAPRFLLGAHYDTVPGTPGADDNGSAIAVCLECARILAMQEIDNTMIAIFNCEEDGLLGSRDFVAHRKSAGGQSLEEVHIFEMVGYCSHEPGSQSLPSEIPIKGPDVGDFLALLANQHSNSISEAILKLAATYLPGFPVLALKTYFGLEKHFPHLQRSDHAPFWEAGVPALMWTDTSEFRNANYHAATDTPDTLDYSYMKRVTQLTLARILSRSQHR